MTIRPAVPADAAAIAAVEALAAHHPWTADQVAGSLALPTTRGFVAVDGAIVGHALASAAGGVGEILTIAVHPEARRRGLGRALLLQAMASFDDVDEAFLEVRVDNGPARALYAATGWTQVGARRAYYRDGTDAAVYRWVRNPAGT